MRHQERRGPPPRGRGEVPAAIGSLRGSLGAEAGHRVGTPTPARRQTASDCASATVPEPASFAVVEAAVVCAAGSLGKTRIASRITSAATCEAAAIVEAEMWL